MILHCYDTGLQAAQACGRAILDRLSDALIKAPTATLAISGGNSPKPMFEWFAAQHFPWDRVHVFWVDERAVPPTDPRSNFKLANDAWLQHVPAHVHRIRAEFLPELAAREYVADIQAHFGLQPGELPAFDAVHLGMGPDAHTASLFPGEPVIDDRSDIAAAVRVEKMHQWRVTLLPGVILRARLVAMLVVGKDKRDSLAALTDAPLEPRNYPVQIVRPADPSIFACLEHAD